ncbi:MAG: helix-turn-helix transcriptional regulator [Oligoflexia bacterium]|nr:helix-turn-helix transcriptional regulator [Oligoflexia bacterium]
MTKIGERIKNLMSERRISAKELSASTGISASTIAQWVNYKKEPKADAILKISKYFGVSMEWLITGEHPEVEILKAVAQSLEKQFVELHQGIYRVRIDKQIEVPKKKED